MRAVAATDPMGGLLSGQRSCWTDESAHGRSKRAELVDSPDGRDRWVAGETDSDRDPTLSSTSRAAANLKVSKANPSGDQLHLVCDPLVNRSRLPVSGGLSPRRRQRLVSAGSAARKAERDRSPESGLHRRDRFRAAASKLGETLATFGAVASSLIAILDGVNQRGG